MALFSGRKLAPQSPCPTKFSPIRLDAHAGGSRMVGYRWVREVWTRYRGAEVARFGELIFNVRATKSNDETGGDPSVT